MPLPALLDGPTCTGVSEAPRAPEYVPAGSAGRAVKCQIDSNQWFPRSGHGLPEFGRGLLAGLAISLSMLALGGGAIHRDYAQRESARLAHEEQLRTHQRLLEAPPLDVLQVTAAAHGRDIFTASCAACHSADGKGVPGLGKDL